MAASLGPGFRLELDGDVQFDRRLRRTSARADDMRAFFHEVLDGMESVEERLFATQGASGGKRWQKLTPAYRKWKATHGFPTQIMRRTDDLMKSLTLDFDKSAVRRVGRTEVVFGTSVPYAAFHQRGRGVPQRRVLALNRRQRVGLAKALQAFIILGVTQTGAVENATGGLDVSGWWL